MNQEKSKEEKGQILEHKRKKSFDAQKFDLADNKLAN